MKHRYIYLCKLNIKNKHIKVKRNAEFGKDLTNTKKTCINHFIIELVKPKPLLKYSK